VIGGTIGHFKVVSRLGRGGMGEVFAGEHEGIQTKVAIKVLHEDISKNVEHVKRFFNEAKVVGKIKHAGIVKIFDVGHHEGHAYLIMELLEGEPLSARIERIRRLPWQDVAELGRQIASVLDATHRAGIIHRDLKPDNIFLVQDHELAAGERVKILDFGISKLSATMAGPKTHGTMGTPAYMAPEQWAESAEVDWRADAYSLGCVLFEMATGGPPFVASSIAGAYAQHLASDPPLLRDVAAVPEALHALVMRLLAKEPADRGTSMGAIARELAAIAGNAQAAVSTPGPLAVAVSGVAPTLPSVRTTLGSSAAELTRKPAGPRRNRVWVVGSGVAVLGVVAVIAAMALRSPPDAPATPTAVSTPDAAVTAKTVVPQPPHDALADAKRAFADRRWADAIAAIDAAGATTDEAKQLRAQAVVEAQAEQDRAAIAGVTGDTIDLRAAERALAKIPLTSSYRKAAEDAVAAARRRELELDLDRARVAAARADGCVTYARVLREIAEREPVDLSREVAHGVSCAKAPPVKPPDPPKPGSGSGSGSGSGFGGRV
jgi:serine/threonine-protein kinase